MTPFRVPAAKLGRARTSFFLLAVAAAIGLLLSVPASATVTLVESGHTLNQIVDSAVPLDATQSLLDTTTPIGDIEGIAVDPVTGTIYVQLQPPGFTSTTTSIYSVTPAGVVSTINANTGLGGNARGTDLHLDPATGLLLTLDQISTPSERIATIDPSGGAVGTYAFLPTGLFFGNSFGMDFSAGAGGSVVPAGDVVFTSDGNAHGIHSSPSGGPVATHTLPVTKGDDLVIQPDGDWVHVPDHGGIITAHDPFAPFTGTPSTTGLAIEPIFTGAGLSFVFGSRATVCDVTGDLYISYSGKPGGTGIFRVNEALTTATHVLTVSGNEGIQDLTMGPATSGAGLSVYFTIHDITSSGEEVWEVTVPECSQGEPTPTPQPTPTATPTAMPTPTPIPAGLGHFLFYKVIESSTGLDLQKFIKFAPVTLSDQFRSAPYQIGKPKRLGLPANKNDEGFEDEATHLLEYGVKGPKFTPIKDVRIANQCNDLYLEVKKPVTLMVPTSKSLTAPVPAPNPSQHNVDHFLCYKARLQKKLSDGTPLPGFPVGTQVVVTDQFEQNRRFDLKKITKLCNPVDKSGYPVLQAGPNRGEQKLISPAAIRNYPDHLVCYVAKPAKQVIPQEGCGCAPGVKCKGPKLIQGKHQIRIGVHLGNQFGPEVVDTKKPIELCIPSTKSH